MTGPVNEGVRERRLIAIVKDMSSLLSFMHPCAALLLATSSVQIVLMVLPMESFAILRYDLA